MSGSGERKIETHEMHGLTVQVDNATVALPFDAIEPAMHIRPVPSSDPRLPDRVGRVTRTEWIALKELGDDAWAAWDERYGTGSKYAWRPPGVEVPPVEIVKSVAPPAQPEKFVVWHLPSNTACVAASGPVIYTSEQEALNSIASVWRNLVTYGARWLNAAGEALVRQSMPDDRFDPEPLDSFAVRPFTPATRPVTG